MFCLPDGYELTAPSKNQEKSSFVTVQLPLKNSNFLGNLDGKFEIDNDECVIEVEAKTHKGDQYL